MSRKYKARALYAIVAVMLLASGILGNGAHAAVLDSNILPEPVGNFINNAKLISGEILEKAGDINIEDINYEDVVSAPTGIYDRADNWFFETTGLHIKEAFKSLLNVFIGILSFFLDILRWIASLV